MNVNRNKEIEKLKKIITNLFICYNNLTSKESIENRTSNDILKYKEQLDMDNIFILSVRNNALELFDKCNQLLMENK